MNPDQSQLDKLRDDIAAIGKLRTVRVLVVDDESDTRLLIRDILNPYNVAINEASNGDRALESLALVKYDVVLLDVKMPGLDGIAVHREIKMRWPSVRVFLVTGYPEWPGVRNALEDGFVRVISKNFLEKSLKEIFEPLCTKKAT